MLPVIVHQGDEAHGAELTARHGVSDWPRVADPERKLYAAFGLEQGGVAAVVGPKSIARGIGAFFSGHRMRVPVGDIRQMPGVFVLEGDRIVAEFRHRSVADRPDYLALAQA